METAILGCTTVASSPPRPLPKLHFLISDPKPLGIRTIRRPILDPKPCTHSSIRNMWAYIPATTMTARSVRRTSGEVREPNGEADPGSEEEGLAGELESLEEEIMTVQDEGREPDDYDKRAHIFDESSRVFRRLRERSQPQATQSSEPVDDGE